MATHPKGKLPPDKKLSKEVLAEISQKNGRRGGRPVGAINRAPIEAANELVKMKHRLPPGVDPAAAEVAGYGLMRIVDVMAGRVHSRKAPSVLKAAIAIRDEIAGPIVQKVESTNKVSFESLVVQAAKRIEGK